MRNVGSFSEADLLLILPKVLCQPVLQRMDGKKMTSLTAMWSALMIKDKPRRRERGKERKREMGGRKEKRD